MHDKNRIKDKSLITTNVGTTYNPSCASVFIGYLQNQELSSICLPTVVFVIIVMH